jgi:glutathione S-transferase
MLKIYYSPLSGSANKVRMCANALKIDYEPIALDMREGAHKKPEFLAVNPFGKVPAIDDDGFYLFESNAIMKYLCRKHGSGLYPSDLQSQAFVDQWCDFAASLLVPAYGRVVFNWIIAPMSGARVSEESLEDGLKFIGNYLPVIDKRLSTARFFAGQKMTIADLAILAALDPSETCGIELSGFEALYTWREKLRAKPFYRAVHEFYGQGVLPGAGP